MEYGAGHDVTIIRSLHRHLANLSLQPLAWRIWSLEMFQGRMLPILGVLYHSSFQEYKPLLPPNFASKAFIQAFPSLHPFCQNRRHTCHRKICWCGHVHPDCRGSPIQACWFWGRRKNTVKVASFTYHLLIIKQDFCRKIQGPIPGVKRGHYNCSIFALSVWNN